MSDDERAGGDVVVIGAGLIGLAMASSWRERGATVRVYDRDEPARAASWAGAGMLAPYTETLRDEALLELCVASLRDYPAFVERVRAGRRHRSAAAARRRRARRL